MRPKSVNRRRRHHAKFEAMEDRTLLSFLGDHAFADGFGSLDALYLDPDGYLLQFEEKGETSASGSSSGADYSTVGIASGSISASAQFKSLDVAASLTAIKTVDEVPGGTWAAMASLNYVQAKWSDILFFGCQTAPFTARIYFNASELIDEPGISSRSTINARGAYGYILMTQYSGGEFWVDVPVTQISYYDLPSIELTYSLDLIGGRTIIAGQLDVERGLVDSDHASTTASLQMTSVKILDPVLGEIDPKVVYYDSQLTAPPPASCVDISVATPVVKPDGSAQFTYTVTDSSLPTATTVDLYWADANNNILGTIHSEAANPAEGSHTVNVASVGTPPLGATHILVKADPGNAITETNENNNEQSLLVIADPTVTLQVNPSNPSKGQVYSIVASVTNNSLISQTYSISLNELPIGKTETNNTLLTQSITLSASESIAFRVDSHKIWDWIDRNNPITVSGEFFGEIWPLLKDMAWDEIIEGFSKSFPRTGGIIARAIEWQEWLNPLIERINGIGQIPQLDFNYQFTVSGGPTGNISSLRNVRVTVPWKFQVNLSIFLNAMALGKTYLNVATTVLDVLPIFVTSMVLAGAKFDLAKLAYAQAVDPPDPNYTQIAVPETPQLAEIDALPDGPLKNLTLLNLELYGVRVAEATSRDRGLGAREAGDDYWESMQLIATSEFAAQATALETRIAHLQGLISLSSAFSSPIAGSDVINYLETNGLSGPFADTLLALGWTEEEIETLRLNLIQIGADGLTVPEGSGVTWQQSSLYAGVLAIEELREGIQIRTERLGAVPRDLTPTERADLDAMKNAIEAGFAQGFLTETFLSTIASYLADAHRLALETDNFEAVAADLDYGYAALMDFQYLNATPAGLRHHVDQLEANGQIDNGIADALRTSLAQAEQYLSNGDFNAAQQSLAQFTGIAAGLPASIADDLTSYASYIGGYLEADNVVVPPPLTVAEVVVNGGAQQRSNIESIAVQFSHGTNLQALINDGSILSFVQVVALEDGRVITLTTDHFRWDATTNTLLIDLTIDSFGGSTRTLLEDGLFDLRLRTDGILADGRALEDTDGTADGFMTYGFHRLFGDTDGDGDVDNLDLFVLRSAFGKRADEIGFLNYLDSNGDGIIDAFDQAEFVKRRPKRLVRS